MKTTEEQQPQKGKNRKNKKKNNEGSGLGDYAKYTGMATQMIVIILVTTWGGIKLDDLLGFEKPLFTIILSLLGVFAAIYTAVKDFIK
jgi:F0F1-type ATP synthase assembly protein I